MLQLKGFSAQFGGSDFSLPGRAGSVMPVRFRKRSLFERFQASPFGKALQGVVANLSAELGKVTRGLCSFAAVALETASLVTLQIGSMAMLKQYEAAVYPASILLEATFALWKMAGGGLRV